MASMNIWLNEQIAIHNIRVSPRLPIEDRVKRFYTIYAERQGITLDEEDAELCSMLVNMRHGEGVDAGDVIEALYVTDTVAAEEPVEYTNQNRQSRQVDLRKCRRSPRLNK
jgi:hypothetical protein